GGSTGTGSTGTGTGTTGTGPTATGGGAGGPSNKTLNDTSHCVSGRQFSPSLFFYAPPCVKGVPGMSLPNNGGATYQGVSGTTIEIVNYVSDYGAEVDQILKAQGLYYNASQAAVWNKTYVNFINSHYQLWGRKIHIDTIEGNCRTVPPDYQCLIGDMDKTVAKYHPYAVIWDTTVCSECFAELSRLHVVNLGGFGFSDAFHAANAPYSWDAGESSTRIEQEFADWWCHQMTSQGGSGRTAIYAGTQNPAENFTKKPRVLGVVSTNDPDNQNTVQNVLFPLLKKTCGENVGNHYYFYAQNINTAAQQSQTAEERMNTPSNPATSVLCLCDPVAPQFGLNAYANNNYWPESILATDQSMDFDTTGQTYSSKDTSQDHLACPTPQRGCGFDGAVGLATSDPQTSVNATDAVKVYRAQTHQNGLPTSAQTLSIFWDIWSMLGAMIENTGPDLTPQRMAGAAPSMGFIGGGQSGRPLRGFARNYYSWVQDAGVVYWNKNKPSAYNGVPGHWVPIEGRFTLGRFSTMKQPPAPTAANRR
ncbi:MAG: hypothetical protein JO222_01865, partial [Frankiales bacterium]|nr:hypothetical protein [Frankiales bacterium]